MGLMMEKEKKCKFVVVIKTGLHVDAIGLWLDRINDAIDKECFIGSFESLDGDKVNWCVEVDEEENDSHS